MKYYNPSLVRFTDAPRPFTVIDTNAESDARGAIDAKAAAEDRTRSHWNRAVPWANQRQIEQYLIISRGGVPLRSRRYLA
jgi:hypothetical protein